MANLTQQPNSWNAAYVPNVYTLDDISAADQFLLRVYINGTQEAEFRQPPNPSGVAHFDISKVLQSFMEPAFVETTQFVSETPKETLSYRIQYGTVTNNVIDNNLVYAPFKYVINAYDDWRVLNWDDEDFNPNALFEICDVNGNTARWEQKDYLTNYPKDAYPLRSSAYHTLSFFNRMENWGDGTNWPGTTIQPGYVQIKFYTTKNFLIQTSIYSIDASKGLGPRLDFDSTTLGSYTDDEIVGTIGAGPQNLKDAGIWPNGTGPVVQIWNQVTQTWNTNTNIWNLSGGVTSANVGYYTIEIFSVEQCYWNANGAPSNEDASTLMNYLGDLIYSYRFNVVDACTNFNALTVSFINQYGVKDYWTFDRRNTKTVNTSRNNYSQTLGSWSEPQFSINPNGRGKRTFSSNIETEVFMSTNWMDDNESEWLQELFTSPSVELFIDGKWEPCIIGTSMYEEKTYARDKMFQHTISLIYSNNKTVQRG